MALVQNDNLLKVISVLKLLKKNGDLDEDKYFLYQNTKWRNILKYSVIESWLKHHCHLVRLNALALICESKRSTQPFTPTEFDLILLFLKYNLEEKMEFVPFIKKVLKRADVSIVALQRQLNIEEKSLENGELDLEEGGLKIDERINLMKTAIKSYYSFFSSLKDLCLKNIYPAAVHCRSLSALQILILMQEFLKKELTINLWTHDDTQLLVQCIYTDSFEANKQLAFTVIKQSIDSNTLYINDVKIVNEIIDTALSLANSMRPTDSITASFMFKIVVLSPIIDDVLLTYINNEEISNCLTEKTLLIMIKILTNRLTNPIQLAKENIVAACSKHSLYGYLYCILSLLQTLDLRKLQSENSWRKLIAEIVDMCFQLIYIASEIVNNSSPEGHLPMDLRVQNSDLLIDAKTTLVTSQMVLLCSWRLIKETSLLLGDITSRSPIYLTESNPGLISKEQIIKIGEQFVMLLCGTKHRGAIDQAHIGFQQMCNKLFSLKDSSFRQLPVTWLHYLFLDMIGLKSGNFKLCWTRRSAGVPFMVQAITCCTTKRNLDHSIFHSVMRILLGFTQLTDVENLFNDIKSIMYNNTIFCQFEENFNSINNGEKVEINDLAEIKTHTLNILRALFKHYRLKDLVKPYISEGFTAAMKSYDGQSWAERNAATLLIGTLVTRTFGVLRTRDHINLTTHNKMTGKVFFEKYGQLLPFMLEKLNTFITERDEMIDCKMQTILLIISRLYVGNDMENSNSFWQVDKFINLVSQCGTNRVQKTRELAARALVSLLTENNICETLEFLIKNIMETKENLNALHGYMLQLHEIVSVFELSTDIMSKTKFLDFLLNMEKTILQSLEEGNENSACFPAAASFVIILSKLQKQPLSRKLFENHLLDSIIVRLKMHLANCKLLKKKPGKEVYEMEAMNFIILCVKNSFCHELFNVNEENNFWLSILIHVNENIQIISWKNIFPIIEKIGNSKFLHQALFIAFNTKFEFIDNVEVHDAIYEFLYLTLSHLQESNEKNLIVNNELEKTNVIYEFCTIIGKMLTSHMRKNCFYERGIFLQLMEKMFACFSSISKDNSKTPMSRNDVYKLIVNNSWMCSADIDCRIGIAKNLYDLYVESVDINDSYLVLNWWTTLLHLLLDDNMIVRQYASIVICDIKPNTKLGCHSVIMEIFFNKFFNTIGSKNPTIGLAALICWIVTLMDDEELEMDETEVFNKSNIYEYFEPMGISKQCINYIQLIFEQCSVSEIIPEIIKNWLNERLNLQFSEMNTFQELIINCKNRIPSLEGKLKDILDPFYKSKLIQHVGYDDLCQQFSKVVY